MGHAPRGLKKLARGLARYFLDKGNRGLEEIPLGVFVFARSCRLEARVSSVALGRVARIYYAAAVWGFERFSSARGRGLQNGQDP